VWDSSLKKIVNGKDFTPNTSEVLHQYNASNALPCVSIVRHRSNKYIIVILICTSARLLLHKVIRRLHVSTNKYSKHLAYVLPCVIKTIELTYKLVLQYVSKHLVMSSFKNRYISLLKRGGFFTYHQV